MLRITTSDDGATLTMKLEGKLVGPWVEEVDRGWRATWGTRKSVAVDLTGLTFIDASGKKLLAAFYRQGGKLLGSGFMAKSTIEEIVKAGNHNQDSGREHMKRGILKAVLFAVLSAFVAGGQAHAQDQAPLRLTLREAVDLALKQNPQVQIANLQIADSQQDQTIARSALLPQATLETFDRAQRFNLQAFIGGALPGVPQHAGPFQVFQAGPNFSMPILDVTLWRRWQASHQNVRAAEAQGTTVREQTVLLVVSQYLGGLRAAAAVRAAQSRVDLAQALYDQAQDLQKHGVGTGLDALRANVELQNEKQRLIVAETQHRVELYGLVRLLNLDPHRTVELADEPSFFQTPEFDASRSLEQAFAARPEMQALAAQAEAAQLAKKGASASRLPTLAIGGGWAYQGLSLPTVIPSYTYQATVDVPLFTSGRIRAEITKADLQLKRLAQEREDLRNRVGLEVKTALAELDSARHEVDVANLGVNLAQEEVSQARDRFQAGVANNIEVVSAQDALARANDNQIGALYRYNQARVDLSHAIGRTEQLYTK
ncbi:MAG: TolC family protein [Acidobacteriia bacterium]|nr:TolC family protein [Terriglobia bacterium]